MSGSPRSTSSDRVLAALFPCSNDSQESGHWLYKCLIDPSDQVKLEAAYTRFRAYLDPNFATEFKNQTPQRLAELYFAEFLLEQELQPCVPGNAGSLACPDWLVSPKSDSSYKFYVEVTCPTEGASSKGGCSAVCTIPRSAHGRKYRPKSDKLEDSTGFSGHSPDAVDPHEQIRQAVLRLSSRLRDKASLTNSKGAPTQAARACQDGLPFVVAISTMGFDWPIDTTAIDGAFPVPHSGLLFRFLLGLDESLRWRTTTIGKEEKGGALVTQKKSKFKKCNGGDVAAGVFLPDAEESDVRHFSAISAILLCGWSPLRSKPSMVCLVHNLNARNPLRPGTIGECVEYETTGKGNSWITRIRKPGAPAHKKAPA